jgi:hypothetical protein
MRRRILASLTALALLAILGATSVTATVTTTEAIAGNPTCDGTKIDPVAAGSYALVGGGHIVITLTAGSTFSFDTEGSALVSSIVVKGGPNALLWSFDPPVTSATGLHAQVNPANGKYYGLSHLCINSSKKTSDGGGKK